MRRQKTFTFCKELMALPYLPKKWIEPVFRQISAKELSPQLRQLVNYVEINWIQHNTFVIKSWSVYRRQFRTNNVCEGWHHHLNLATNHAGLNFYRLVSILHDEAIDVEHICQFLSKDVILRRQRKSSQPIHRKIQEAWDEFSKGQKN